MSRACGARARSARQILRKASSWSFDVFELDTACDGQSATALVLHCCRVHSLDTKLGLHVPDLVRFLIKVEKGYLAPSEVPFHNHVHAADVVHGVAFLLSQEAMRRLLRPLDMYAMLLAALMHDYRHPGVTNAFLVATSDPRAILYNDGAVLEHYHCAEAWRLMALAGHDPFGSLSRAEYLEARAAIVEAILGTDLKAHFDHLSRFRTRRAAGAFDAPERRDLLLLLSVCLHAADVSNLAKPWHLSLRWVALLFEEGFALGDRERELGMSVSALNDREKTDIAKSEIGFASFMILPYYEELGEWLGEPVASECVERIRENIARWRAEGESALGEYANALRRSPRALPDGQAQERTPLGSLFDVPADTPTRSRARRTWAKIGSVARVATSRSRIVNPTHLQVQEAIATPSATTGEQSSEERL